MQRMQDKDARFGRKGAMIRFFRGRHTSTAGSCLSVGPTVVVALSIVVLNPWRLGSVREEIKVSYAEVGAPLGNLGRVEQIKFRSVIFFTRTVHDRDAF
jgi:hypothetical protein